MLRTLSVTWPRVSNRRALARALGDLHGNPEQRQAVSERGHCVVLAGPGSGKTKTLTIAMAAALTDEVPEPRGVACITYNNECAFELESRLAAFGIEGGDRVFIGTVHSFALAQIISPYARCIPGLLPESFEVATADQCKAAVETAYAKRIADAGNPHDRWKFAQEKRRRDVDRNAAVWSDTNPELASFIEGYEAELRARGLIDFDDMPLIAYRMVRDHRWIADALRARFPVLFVDEYQDLAPALHELVQLLCFQGGMRLFAVGDADQSIYGFNGANPRLLQGLSTRGDVTTIRLRFNYRSGSRIIRASLGALGEDRNYRGVDGAPEGRLLFWPVALGHAQQAEHIASTVVPALISDGTPLEEIAVLYRAAWLGDKVADALDLVGLPFVRTDVNALVKRGSRLGRFIEACASWVTGGWRNADPPFARLVSQAIGLVYGGRASEVERLSLSSELITFLLAGIGTTETTHDWLQRFDRELIGQWRARARASDPEWEVSTQLIERTSPARDGDMPLNLFAGRVEGTGRITLSTFHSAKGREFDAAILFGINDGDIPNWRDRKSERAMREARRLFYVGVTRPRKDLCLVYQEHHHSPWVAELSARSQQD